MSVASLSRDLCGFAVELRRWPIPCPPGTRTPSFGRASGWSATRRNRPLMAGYIERGDELSCRLLDFPV
jgi:hypothetical protein